MHRCLLVILLSLAGLLGLAWAAQEGNQPTGGPPPLVVDQDAPLLLEEPQGPSLAPTPRAATENAACFVCHLNYREEPLAIRHAAADVACSDCHGPSYAHRNDENNTTPPDLMYPRGSIDAGCRRCHTTHNAAARQVISLWLQRCPDKREPEAIVCTDCHGEHRLKMRTVRWDRQTRRLLTGVEQPPPASRSFWMGFSDWPCGPALPDVLKTLERIHAHSDLISFQFNDGIPWPEAYEGTPYSTYLEERIAFRLQQRKPGRKVYLEIAALNMDRSDIAGYVGTSGNLPRPAPWDTQAIDDERMITAYANFCLDLIGRFQPDWVNYGLESTEYLFHHPNHWPAFVRFHQAVYRRLKARYPEVPLGISMPLKHPDSPQAKQLHERVADLLPYADFLAGSCYPWAFFGHPQAGNPANLPARWLTQLVDAARGKPIAMGETNWIAEDLVLPRWDLNVRGTPEWQARYLEILLPALQEQKALFLVWWAVADYDRLWESSPAAAKDLGRLWRDTGLYDGELQPRPALQVWDAWLKKGVRGLVANRP